MKLRLELDVHHGPEGTIGCWINYPDKDISGAVYAATELQALIEAMKFIYSVLETKKPHEGAGKG